MLAANFCLIKHYRTSLYLDNHHLEKHYLKKHCLKNHYLDNNDRITAELSPLLQLVVLAHHFVVDRRLLKPDG